MSIKIDLSEFIKTFMTYTKAMGDLFPEESKKFNNFHRFSIDTFYDDELKGYWDKDYIKDKAGDLNNKRVLTLSVPNTGAHSCVMMIFEDGTFIHWTGCGESVGDFINRYIKLQDGEEKPFWEGYTCVFKIDTPEKVSAVINGFHQYMHSWIIRFFDYQYDLRCNDFGFKIGD